MGVGRIDAAAAASDEAARRPPPLRPFLKPAAAAAAAERRPFPLRGPAPLSLFGFALVEVTHRQRQPLCSKLFDFGDNSNTTNAKFWNPILYCDKCGIFWLKLFSEEFPCIVSFTSKFHLCFFGGGERERASSSSSLGGEIREEGRKERKGGGGMQ